MTSGKLVITLATALVFGQLQCAAWCTVKTCDLSETTATQKVPPCHRHPGESSKQSPADACSHVVVIASVDSSAAQAAITLPFAPKLPVEPETNSRSLILGNAFAQLTSSPPGSRGLSSLVLRI